jgi:hypothetical protein
LVAWPGTLKKDTLVWKTKGSIEEGVKGSQAFQHILISGIKKEEHHPGAPRETLQNFSSSEVSPTNARATHTHTHTHHTHRAKGAPSHRVGAKGHLDYQSLCFIAYELVLRNLKTELAYLRHWFFASQLTKLTCLWKSDSCPGRPPGSRMEHMFSFGWSIIYNSMASFKLVWQLLASGRKGENSSNSYSKL